MRNSKLLNDLGEALDKARALRNNSEFASAVFGFYEVARELLPVILYDATQEELEPVWKASGGREIPISQLEDNHLRNIIRFIREVRWSRRYDQLPDLLAEARKRGLKNVH